MPSNTPKPETRRLDVLHLALFAMFGALMFGTKFAMELLPSIHLLALFIGALTLVYRKGALVPIYVFVLLDGVREGFSLWWIAYLYVWLPLWGAFMLLPKKMPAKVAVPVYALVCGLHGLAFGTMFAPVWMVTAHLDWRGIISWVAAGLTFDVMHCISNIAFALLILPLAGLLRKLERRAQP